MTRNQGPRDRLAHRNRPARRYYGHRVVPAAADIRSTRTLAAASTAKRASSPRGLTDGRTFEGTGPFRRTAGFRPKPVLRLPKSPPPTCAAVCRASKKKASPSS